MSIQFFFFSLFLVFLSISSINSCKCHKKQFHKFLKVICAKNPSIPPNINIQLSMVGKGFFSLSLPGPVGEENKDIILKYHSKFMQDSTKRRLYLSSGDESLGDVTCFNKYWYEEHKFYVMTFLNNNCSSPICQCISGYGYDENTNAYNSTHLGYIGRFYSYKAKREVDAYTGRALDAAGPLTVVLHIGVSDGAYVAIQVLEVNSLTGFSPLLPYFIEYFYNDAKMIRPDPKYFIVPELCLKSERTNGCSKYPY